MEENRNEMEMNNIETSTNEVAESNYYEDNSGSGDALTAALVIGISAAVGCAIYDGSKRLFKFAKKKAESIRTKREAAKIVDAENTDTDVEEETK